jgi:NAD(P)-dependent dehydrogenase (short-subunit alcohol dehydrogenase family)
MRNLGRAEELLKATAEGGVSVTLRQLDVTDAGSIEACFDQLDRLDVLVNNAGRGNTFTTIESCDLARYRADIEVNFFGVVATTKAALPLLRASQGRLITVGATRGVIGQPFNEGYSAAKFAVEGFLESLAPALSHQGVRVSVIVPGPVLGSRFGANTAVTRESLLAEAGPYTEALDQLPGLGGEREVAGRADSRPRSRAVIVAAMRDPDPAFRIPTSPWAAEYLAQKLIDPSGRAIAAMTRSWLEANIR